MSRRDAHFDAMLKNLGATYYQAIHGDASTSDVTRALEAAEAGNGQHHTSALLPPGHPRSGRWRVIDVMTTEVVTVDMATPFKQVARIMAEEKVNAVPVLTKDRRVVGMVSEDDLLRKEARGFSLLGLGLPRLTRRQRRQAEACTAKELMSSPPITVHPYSPVGAAARLMNGHHIRRVPVVDSAGELVGIVSRRDLLSVFLRPDAEIAAEVRATLTQVLLEESAGVEVGVRDGVVTLSGSLARTDLIQVAQRLASQVDGVVSVLSRLSSPAAT
jgi:CBS domain-containing protein